MYNYAEHTRNALNVGWAYEEMIAPLNTRKCLKIEYLGRIEYDFQKSHVTGPWDHKDSVSAKKCLKNVMLVYLYERDKPLSDFLFLWWRHTIGCLEPKMHWRPFLLLFLVVVLTQHPGGNGGHPLRVGTQVRHRVEDVRQHQEQGHCNTWKEEEY